jgi:hypothetical protein
LDCVARDCTRGWGSIAREFQRIGRIPPVEYNSSAGSTKQARADAEAALFDLAWEKVYDFCERLQSHLACDLGHSWNDEWVVKEARSEVQT